MKAYTFSFITLIVTLLFASFGFATSIYIGKTEGTGVDEASLQSTHELITTAVSQSSGFEISNQKNSAEFILSPKLLKLGDSYILKIDKLNKTNSIVYSSKLKAHELSDMDTVAQRVVRSVLTETATERNAEINDVTETEQRESTRRYQATRQWLFSFGPARSSGINASKDNVQWNLGYVWGLDPDWDVKINYSSYAPSGNARFSDLSLGVNYYFSKSKHAAFLTTGFGRASADVEMSTNNFLNLSDDTASGWSFNAGIGYKFFRTSTVNFAIIANHIYLTEKTSKTNQTPQLTSLTLALFY